MNSTLSAFSLHGFLSSFIPQSRRPVDGTTSNFEHLPAEVIMSVFGCLDTIQDLKSLQLVCRRFYRLARDGQIWRSLCFESSLAGHRHARATIPKTIPSRQVQALQAEVAGLQSFREELTQTRQQARAQEMQKWDPSGNAEATDWFREYVARQARVKLQWAKNSTRQIEEEIDGVALFGDSQVGKHAFLRFEDDSVGIWNLGESATRPGRVIRNRTRILEGGFSSSYEGTLEDRAAMSSGGISECISIDHRCDKAYVAVDCQLNEIDLLTLKLSGCTTYPRPISALSNCVTGSQLIVGTSTGLHRHDPRISNHRLEGDGILLNQEYLQQPHFATGPQLPLSIIQTPSSNASNTMTGSSEIYVAGRYPSVLLYDQRTFPRVKQSIWSGATFSSLSLIPQLLPQIPVREDGQVHLSRQSTSDDGPVTNGHTLVAAGAKNGKGSLELYAIDRDNGRVMGNIRNRTMASRVKLLSAVPHGRRICVSDADGNVKWFERDGFTLVRQININDLSLLSSSSSSSSSASPSSSPLGGDATSGGLFGSRQDNGDVVQKLIPIGGEENADLLVWAGSRAGLIAMGKENDGEDASDSEEVIGEDEKKSREYEAHMRRLLEASAMEARRMQNFGL